MESGPLSKSLQLQTGALRRDPSKARGSLDDAGEGLRVLGDLAQQQGAPRSSLARLAERAAAVFGFAVELQAGRVGVVREGGVAPRVGGRGGAASELLPHLLEKGGVVLCRDRALGLDLGLAVLTDKRDRANSETTAHEVGVNGEQREDNISG